MAARIDPIPQPLALGELPIQARNLIWSYVYELLKESSSRQSGWSGSILSHPWDKILRNYHVFSLFLPGDEFSTKFDINVNKLKTLILEGEFNRVFDFLEFVLRHQYSPPNMRKILNKMLEKLLCAYLVVEEGPSIVPIANQEQRQSIEKVFLELKSGPFEGAQSHLLQSAKNINIGDFAGSVRESIHAVESVARRIVNNSTTLKPALDALVKQNVDIHPAFLSGIEKFYGYTNDKHGIRHALLESATNVDEVDALFMFNTCASFTAFLVHKSRKAGILIE